MGLPNNLGKLSNMITSTGSAVGVNTTTPFGIFNVVAGTNKSLIIQDSGIADTIEIASYSTSGGTRAIAMNGSVLTFGTGTAGGGSATARLTINATGNVGIGTSSPSRLLTVVSSSDGITAGISGATYGIRFDNGGTFSSGMSTIHGVDSTLTGSYQPIMINGSDVRFGTSATQRMMITSGGRGLFGTTTPSAGAGNFGTSSFQVNNEVVSMGSLAGFFFENRSGGVTSTSNWYGWYAVSAVTYFYNGASNIASINTSSGAYTALSDINKKKDFEESRIGLNAILCLKPTLFRMKDDEETSEKQLGFIAQEVREHIPQAYVETGEDDDKFIGLTDRPIIAALVKAIQEQQEIINNLSAKVTALENK